MFSLSPRNPAWSLYLDRVCWRLTCEILYRQSGPQSTYLGAGHRAAQRFLHIQICCSWVSQSFINAWGGKRKQISVSTLSSPWYSTGKVLLTHRMSVKEIMGLSCAGFGEPTRTYIPHHIYIDSDITMLQRKMMIFTDQVNDALYIPSLFWLYR